MGKYSFFLKVWVLCVSVGSYGQIWVFMASKVFMGKYGSLWASMGSYGQTWEIMGFY